MDRPSSKETEVLFNVIVDLDYFCYNVAKIFLIWNLDVTSWAYKSFKL